MDRIPGCAVVVAMVGAVFLVGCAQAGGGTSSGGDGHTRGSDSLAADGAGPAGGVDAAEEAASGTDAAARQPEAAVCRPVCAGKECGPDGCYGDCGECETGEECTFGGTCLDKADPCKGLVCGTGVDGVTVCGICPCSTCPVDATVCQDGHCHVSETLRPECGLSSCCLAWDCISFCPVDDQACFQECLNSAPIGFPGMPGEEWKQCLLEHFWSCWELCPEMPDDWKDCPPDARACFEQGSAECWELEVACCHGDFSCPEMWQCVKECPQDVAGCASHCIRCGSVDAQKAWKLFTDCLDERGYFDCPVDDSACAQGAWDQCYEQLDACLGGGGA